MHCPTSQKMTNKAIRFIQSIANVQFTKTNISQFKSQAPSNTFKVALMGGRDNKHILLSKKKLRQNYRRYFTTFSSSNAVLGRGRKCISKTTLSQSKSREMLTGDSVLYLTIVTLFMYMNVVNYYNVQY